MEQVRTIDWIEQYMTEAVNLIHGGQVNEGIHLLKGLLYEEPGYGGLHNHIGWAYLYYTGDLMQAELHLNAAIKFKTGYGAPYQHLGSVYIRMGRYSDAIRVLQDGIMEPQANKAAMYELVGQAYELKSELKLAIKAYKKAMMTSVIPHEVTMFSESIKRCRQKRWASLMS